MSTRRRNVRDAMIRCQRSGWPSPITLACAPIDRKEKKKKERRTRVSGTAVRFPQELIDGIIDHVGYAKYLGACSLVGHRWAQRSRRRSHLWRSGYCSSIHQQQYNSPRNNLFTKGSIFAENIHTHPRIGLYGHADAGRGRGKPAASYRPIESSRDHPESSKITQIHAK